MFFYLNHNIDKNQENMLLYITGQGGETIHMYGLTNDELLAFIRAINGEENFLENMEVEGQQKAIRRNKMAKSMRPEKEIWEQLGFKFSEIEDDDILYDATLPEGWSMQATEHAMWINILDPNGRIRGKMFYKAAFYDRRADMSLNCRYDIYTEHVDKDYSTRIVYFGNPEEKLFVAGQIKRRNSTGEEGLKAYREEQELREIATKWANENYPDWKNVNAYWDLPTKKESKTKKHTK